ncbi:hypothetical protein GW17_00009135 [Ensete ventricosum]|nr:hypothetical protein GW17_00009135 [Ensete ventricosum]
MCDNWIVPTRMSIIIFLCIATNEWFFISLVNASDKIQDANYTENLMDTIMKKINLQYIVQIVTDNGVIL